MKRLRLWKRFAKFATLAILALLFTGAIVWEFVLPGELGGGSAPVSLPLPGGPYAVGRKSYHWTDATRRERFDTSAKREIMAWVWYPATSPKGSNPSAYLPGKWGHLAAKWQARMLNVRLFRSTHRLTLSTRGLERTRIHAVDDAPVSGDRRCFPVLLFSPAIGQMPTDYTALLEDIASHGFVVVGIHPTYFTTVTMFPDGRQAGFLLPWARGTTLEDFFPTWVADMIFALDQAAKLDAESGGPFSGRLDMARVGAFGHSYGGAAAAGACHLDPRIKAGIDLDGSPRGHPFAWRLEQPFMLVQSWPARGREGRFCHSLKIGYRFAIEGSKHRAFSDEVLLPIPDPAREELVGTIGGPRMVRITSDLVRGFFDVYLNGATSPLLASPSSVYPEVKAEK